MNTPDEIGTAEQNEDGKMADAVGPGPGPEVDSESQVAVEHNSHSGHGDTSIHGPQLNEGPPMALKGAGEGEGAGDDTNTGMVTEVDTEVDGPKGDNQGAQHHQLPEHDWASGGHPVPGFFNPTAHAPRARKLPSASRQRYVPAVTRVERQGVGLNPFLVIAGYLVAAVVVSTSARLAVIFGPPRMFCAQGRGIHAVTLGVIGGVVLVATVGVHWMAKPSAVHTGCVNPMCLAPVVETFLIVLGVLFCSLSVHVCAVADTNHAQPCVDVMVVFCVVTVAFVLGVASQVMKAR